MKKSTWHLAIAVILGLALAVRLFNITSSPPSLYWEEVALGYDAYSIAQTRRDHHGTSWPLVAFESFGDWKPSGYFYALVPFIKTLGLSAWAVRLPSVLAGVGIVAGLGVLSWQLSQKILADKARYWLSLITLALASISPWLIQFSRAGWEANLASFFILWGVIFGWRSVSLLPQKRTRFSWLLGCIVFLFAAMYTYHSARILAPALGLLFGWRFIKQDLEAKRKNVWLVGYILPLFLTAFLLQPFQQALGTPALRQRLAETSIFNDLTIIEQSNQLKAFNDNSLLSRIIYHRYVLYSNQVTRGFLDHFRVDFLFLNGDGNPRHSTTYFGLFYPFEVVFLLVGAGWVVKKLTKQQLLLLIVWLVAGILPSALTKTTPHALRILSTAPVFLLTTAFGVWQTWDWVSKQVNKRRWQRVMGLLPWTTLAIYLFFFTAFYKHLLVVYPQMHSSEWQYGYRELVDQVEVLRAEYPDLPVYITREQGRPAMYYWFYTQTDPTLVQAVNDVAKKDQGEFLEFENIRFVRSLTEVTSTPAIVAGSPGQVSQLKIGKELGAINNLADVPVWQLAIVE